MKRKITLLLLFIFGINLFFYGEVFAATVKPVINYDGVFEEIRTGDFLYGINRPMFYVTKTVKDSLPFNTDVKVTFQTEILDNTSAFDTVNSRFLPLVAGWYYIYGVTEILDNSLPAIPQSGLKITLKKNGSSDIAFGIYGYSSHGSTVQLSCFVYLNGSTDYIEMYAYQGYDNTAPDITTETDTWFSGFLINATVSEAGGAATTFLSLTDTPDSYSGYANNFIKVNSGATGLEFTTSTVAAHNVLSANHPDTTPASLTVGDILVAQGATPLWGRKAIGTQGQLLSVGASNTLSYISPGSANQILFNNAGNLTGSANAIFNISTGKATFSLLDLTSDTLKINSAYASGNSTSTINFANSEATLKYYTGTAHADTEVPTTVLDSRFMVTKSFTSAADFDKWSAAIGGRFHTSFDFATWPAGVNAVVGHSIYSYLENNMGANIAAGNVPELVGIESYVYALTAASNAGMSGIEAQVVKYDSAVTEGQMIGLSAVIISQVDPTSYLNGSGVRAYSGNIGSGAFNSSVRQYAGFVSTGDKGWKYPFLAKDTDTTTTIFSVNQNGLIYGKAGFITPNNIPYYSTNAAGNAYPYLIFLDTNDDIKIGYLADKVLLGWGSNETNPVWLNINGSSVNISGAAANGTVYVVNSTDVLSALTSSTGNKVLYNSAGTISWNSITGTGNAVFSASPTLTGTITAAAINASGVIDVASNVWITGGSQNLIKYDGSGTVWVGYGSTTVNVGQGSTYLTLLGQNVTFGANDSCGAARCVTVPNI